MAKKGLSRLFLAAYNYSEETKKVTYSEGCENEKLASYSTEISSSDPSNLYLNNKIAETEGGTFTNGTLTLETGDLSPESSKMICGLKENEITLDDDSGTKVKEMVWDDDLKPVNLGAGLIELHQVNGVEFHRAIILPKVFFNVPSDSATTKGESVEWQTQEISGVINRSDEVDSTTKRNHPWKLSADCESEEIAVAYIKKVLNITDPVGTLSVDQSTGGTDASQG